MKQFVALALVVLVAACLSANASARAKTDLVWLKNGDRVTGEIKQLSRGIIQFKTNDIGTLSIEWEDVDSLNSSYLFRVEDVRGEKQFGTIILTREGNFEVVHRGATEHMPVMDVVEITPLEATFWQKLDGSIAIGFSYTKATTIGQLNSDINVRYRTTIRQLAFDASTIETSQEGEDSKRREDVMLTYNRLFPGRWFSTSTGGLQTNDELGLNLRLLFSSGAGLNLLQTNHNEMVASAGLSVNREWSANQDGGYNLEAFASLEHSVFRYDYPKTDITVDATVYPNLTTSGRVRAEIDVSASREIVKDLTIVISFYDSYDNKPLDAEAEKNDYGLVSSLGWTF